jgi:citrate lyase subunit alpha/citrate CoA-transferase
MKNKVGRNLPQKIGTRKIQGYQGSFAIKPSKTKASLPPRCVYPGESKLCASLDDAIRKSGLGNGGTISFHHHLRNGDRVVNMVMDRIAKMGFRDIGVVPSAFFPVHKPLIDHIKKGVITNIQGSLNGPLGAFISQGEKLENPVVLRSHGGRARAIAAGEVTIDVAFLAAPVADDYGNCNGSWGCSAFGAMGFPIVDSLYARKVVIITDNLQPYPVTPISIPQTCVDYVVCVDSIGDPQGIKTGTMEITRSPARLLMAKNVVRLLDCVGVLRDGFSFQAGAGGTSLAVTKFLHDHMKKQGITGGFAMGGITGYVVDMLGDGTINRILDAQSFDLSAVESMRENPFHQEVSHIMFGDPHTGGCVVNRQDACFLGATEVDLDFNVNVNTHSDGILLHGIGGHQDAAAGSNVTVILAPLLRGRVPVIREKVTTVSTPGDTVDVIATEYGMAINPLRDDLIEKMRKKVPLKDITDLYHFAQRLTGMPREVEFTDDIVAVIEYRDGTVLDTVRKVKKG